MPGSVLITAGIEFRRIKFHQHPIRNNDIFSTTATMSPLIQGHPIE